MGSLAIIFFEPGIEFLLEAFRYFGMEGFNRPSLVGIVQQVKQLSLDQGIALIPDSRLLTPGHVELPFQATLFPQR
jgi:hypothetical protein